MSSLADKRDTDIEAVMAASRALVAIVARSFAVSRVPITLQQWRVLVIISDYGPMTVGELASWMDVHPSSATRVCDALVKAKLLDRREDPEDRRRTTLSLTTKGRKLVGALLDARREAIGAILDEIPAARRAQLGKAMREFADVAGDQPEHLVAVQGYPASGRVGA